MTMDEPTLASNETGEPSSGQTASDGAEPPVPPGAEVRQSAEAASPPSEAVESSELLDELPLRAEVVQGVAAEEVEQTAELALPAAAKPPAPLRLEPPVGEAPEAMPAAPEVATTTASAPSDSQQRNLPTLSRRQLLKLGFAAVPALLGAGGVYEALVAVAGRPQPVTDAVFARYDAAAHRWGFVVDASACIGCGSCVVACKQENNVPMDGEHTRTWVERHTVAPDGSLTIDSPEAGIHGFAPSPGASDASSRGTSSATTTHFVPRLCMQCEASPCTAVCPVGATYHTTDGVILVDADRCIGCGYCVVACPYGARYLLPAGARTPEGIPGVADKCTFCYHRITRGLQPACVEVCPVDARIFGDLKDPASRVSTILRQRPTKVMRAGLGTRPRVHYLGLEGESI